MRTWMKNSLLVLATVVTFGGTVFVVGGMKSDNIERTAYRDMRLCDIRAIERGTPREACLPPYREAYESATRRGLIGSLIWAAGAVAILWAIIGFFWYVLGWKKEPYEETLEKTGHT